MAFKLSPKKYKTTSGLAVKKYRHLAPARISHCKQCKNLTKM